MGVGASHQGGFEQPRHVEVVDVAALPGEQCLVLESLDGGADEPGAHRSASASAAVKRRNLTAGSLETPSPPQMRQVSYEEPLGARASRPPGPEAHNGRPAAGPRLSMRAGRPRSREPRRRSRTCRVGPRRGPVGVLSSNRLHEVSAELPFIVSSPCPPSPVRSISRRVTPGSRREAAPRRRARPRRCPGTRCSGRGCRKSPRAPRPPWGEGSRRGTP